MSQIPLPLTTKGRTYALLIGVVMAMLVAGLAIPVLVGEPDRGQSDEVAADDLDTGALADGAGDGAGTDGAAGTSTTLGLGGAAGGTDGTGGTTGGGSGTGGPATDGSAAPSGAALTASDVGVTATTIKIGLLVPTSDTIGSTTDQSKIQVAEFMAFIDKVNAGGGILGRKLVVAIANYDILDQESGTRAACLKLTEDERVFAVFNTTGFGPPGALCVTREKGVPFLQGSGHPAEIYGQANGLYSSTFDSQTRNFANMVWIINQLGALKGKKVAVLGTEWIGLRREQEEGIVNTLKALGFDPFVYWLSGDPVSSQSQVPIAVQQIKASGAKVVFLGADFLSGQTFVQQADLQSYRPMYAAADPWGYSTDYVVKDNPKSFEGAITVTAQRLYDARVGVPEPAIDAGCRQTFEKSTGIRLDRANDPNALYVGTMYACGVVQRFVAAATAAGPNLTRRGLVGAIAGLGSFPVPFSGGPATYRPGKLDGVDLYRPQRWEAGCTCWKPMVAAFTKGHY